MNNRLLKSLTATLIAAMMAVASPALARGGGGHGGFGGGGHFGGGMHAGGFGGMRAGGMGGARFAHAGGPRFAGAGWHGRHGFHHHHFRRFGAFGAPYFYAGYNDGCWRRSWTPYGWQWVNVCGDYW